MPVRQREPRVGAAAQLAAESLCLTGCSIGRGSAGCLLGFPFAEQAVPSEYEYLNDIATGCFGEVQVLLGRPVAFEAFCSCALTRGLFLGWVYAW